MFQKPFVINYLRTFLDTFYMLRKHSVEVYVICIQHICNKIHDISLAKKYLTKGFEYYKNDKLLYVQEIYIELNSIKYGTSMLVVYTKCKNIINKFKNDLDFHVELYDTAKIILKKNKVARCLIHIMKRYVFYK